LAFLNIIVEMPVFVGLIVSIDYDIDR